MAQLSVRLFGSFEARCEGLAVTGLKSDKARALLAYLALEAERPHRREKLAGLFWPEQREVTARANLRRTLSNLRLAIGDQRATPPFLYVSPQVIQLNPASSIWVDVTAFTALLDATGTPQEASGQLEQAVALYRGDLLEGFSLADSPAFEEWALLNRERFRRLMMVTLRRLSLCHEQRGDYEDALRHAWRQVELEPWYEEGHQQVMRLLALSGQRGAALAQYETCCRLLAEELGVEPTQETTLLYEQIRSGALSRGTGKRRGWREPVAAPPPFVTSAPSPPSTSAPFVARERELAQLRGLLDLALTGQGRVVLVMGEAGSGKTALMQEFARRAQEACPDLLLASGNCNAQTGIGDPYLPFREILALLTGDVEARWAVGAVTREHAQRLWNALPFVVQALLDCGPDLIDTLVPGAALLDRARAVPAGSTDELLHLEELLRRRAASATTPHPQQSDLFQQYTHVLLAVAERQPLLLMLDDLQWADTGSVSLFFHLGRQIAGSHILLVGAYRPEDVAVGRDGKRHPLEPVLNQLRREGGDIAVNLDVAEGRGFVQAFLDTEANRLEPAFGQMLHRQTGGHPLFTIELLRGMQERGDLSQDDEGKWVEGPTLDWGALPARVEAVIAERIGRLPEPLQETLRVASVEGEVFTAEVVAEVLGAREQAVVRRLSSDLSRRHRLVAAQSLQRVGPCRLSRYRFRHVLFQKYLYDHLDAAEKAHWHEGVGSWLETVYHEQLAAGDAKQLGVQFPPVGEGAVQLARHFQAAGIPDKAAEYCLHAGIRALLLSANEEALAHFQRGLVFLETLPDSPDRVQQELRLLSALANAIRSVRPPADAQVQHTYARIRELSEQREQVPFPLLNGALWILHFFHVSAAEYRQALEAGEQLLALAPRAGDPLFVATAHVALGWVLPYLGEFSAARDHLQRMIDFRERQPQRPLCFVDQQNLVTALSYQSWALWFLGYPESAAEKSRAALALARELGHAWTLAHAYSTAGAAFHLFRREGLEAQHHVEALTQVSAEAGLAIARAEAMCYRGWQQMLLGQTVEGIQQLQQGLAALQSVQTVRHRPSFLAALAESYLLSDPTQGLAVLAEAFSLTEQTSERYYLAELHRLKGESLRTLGHVAEAEASFHQAIETARQQQARSWELRAVISLCRLWQKQGKRKAARAMLTDIYGWFKQGLDTPDLTEAAALLEQLL